MRHILALLTLVAMVDAAAAGAAPAGRYDGQLQAWLTARAPTCGKYAQVHATDERGNPSVMEMDGFRIARISYSTLTPAESANGVQARGTLAVTALIAREYDFGRLTWTPWWDWQGAQNFEFTVSNGVLAVTGALRSQAKSYLPMASDCSYLEKQRVVYQERQRLAAIEKAAADREYEERRAYVAKWGEIPSGLLATECEGSYYFIAAAEKITSPVTKDLSVKTEKGGDAFLFRVDKESGRSYAYQRKLFDTKWGTVRGRTVGDMVASSFPDEFHWTAELDCTTVNAFVKRTWPK